MYILYLTQEEKQLLRNYFKTSPITLIRLKAQAVTMRDRGMKIKDISLSIFKSKRTVNRWVEDYAVQRIASIFSGLIKNENAAKLTRLQKEEIKKTLSSPPKDTGGLPKTFWDVPTLKTYVRAEFGVEYESDCSYHYLLRFSNLSFKQPDVFDVKRDEVAIRQRMIEIRKEIMPKIKDNDWVILASDETRIMMEAITRRAWLKKGEKTVLKVTRNKESQYYIGFLNIKTGKDHIKALNWGNQKEIIKSLEYVTHTIYPGKKICIIWDNVSFHKGKDLKKKLKKGQSLEKVHLINFPPYAPDCNPQEQVWNMGKDHISNRQFKTFTGTKHSFSRFISTRTFNYTI
jgi:transposase